MTSMSHREKPTLYSVVFGDGELLEAVQDSRWRFPDPVQVPLVHIAEAVMTILFVSLDSGTFLLNTKRS
jgi:hypothetical protein